MNTKYDNVLVMERDWERIKREALAFLPEDQRDQFLETMLKIAVYN